MAGRGPRAAWAEQGRSPCAVPYGLKGDRRAAKVPTAEELVHLPEDETLGLAEFASRKAGSGKEESGHSLPEGTSPLLTWLRKGGKAAGKLF